MVQRSAWLFLAALAGCSLDVAFDGSAYQCRDGRCPLGQTCDSDGICRLEVISGPPDAAVDVDAPSGVDAALAIDASRPIDAAPEPPPPIDAGQPDAAGTTSPAACDDELASPTGDGGCLVLHTSNRTYADAAFRCINNYGGFIAVISSIDEQIALGLLGVHGIADVWIGGDDLQDEGTFVWQGGELVDLDYWAPGEPNNGNANQMGEGQEDCMAAQLDIHAAWDDRPCAATYAYVCEHEPE